MNLNDLQIKESFRLFLRSIYDSITKATTIAQSAANSYADLQDAFDRRVVISEEYNGRQTQNVNISTTFGDNIGGLNSKEFRFLYGSTLKYDRVLPLDHKDTSEVVNLQTLINLVSVATVNYIKKTGDTATGFFRFDPDPLLPNTTFIIGNGVKLVIEGEGEIADVGLSNTSLVNRLFVQNLFDSITIPPAGSVITLGADNTPDSGYALLGNDFAIAWVTGPSTYFTSSTNPLVSLNTPITFDTIYNYSLSSENSESGSLISDNDAWWQMANTPSGNTFNLILQATGGSFAGYMKPKLIVIGKPVNTALTVTTSDKNVMMANGQTYPKLEYITLTSSGGVAPITWQILSTDYGAQFAPGYSDIVQISIPSAPGASPGTSYAITVKATDSLGATATKVIHIIATNYQVVTLVITNTNQSYQADAYPFLANLLLTNSGGDAPITWAVTAHTTFTSAPTISGGNILNLSFQAAGTYTATVQATDSGGTPQVVSKVLTFTVTDYVPPPDPPCFESDETYILMADGSGKLLKDMKASDKILTVSEACLKIGSLAVTETIVTGVTLRPAPSINCVKCKNIKTTQGHAWPVKDDPIGNLWLRSKDIIPSTKLIEVFKYDLQYLAKATLAEDTYEIPAIREAGNMTTLASTYCVGPTPNGPWFVVHNYWSPC